MPPHVLFKAHTIAQLCVKQARLGKCCFLPQTTKLHRASAAYAAKAKPVNVAEDASQSSADVDHDIEGSTVVVHPELLHDNLSAETATLPPATTRHLESPVLHLRRANKLLFGDQQEFSIYVQRDAQLVDVVGGSQVEPLKLQNAVHPRDLEWRALKIDLKKLPGVYLRLSKHRLTMLVVMTTAAGYGMAPGAFDLVTFLLACGGTGFTSCAANTINQFLEVPYDSQMARTKARPLVMGLVSPLHGVLFAASSAITGLSILAYHVNPLTAALGAVNLVLYTLVYTPMKRASIYNTWVGSVVGGIPPVMGWTACTGVIDPGALVLGAVLFAWQFPHFNALSWNLKEQYSKAGYRMMAVTEPALCRATALRYSVVMIGVCSLAPVLGVTTWLFAVDSLPLNAYLTYLAWNFYQRPNAKTSRQLFRFSLVHLPFLMLLMVIGKRYDNRTKEGKAGTTDAQALVVHAAR
ncbi:PREDICTED: protoheme IX farnesyltransferase, mitochondrial-like [Priapulus caudatus]|uniref:Protoheme IX farnesyltransferase, mitochondrial n=1 Tax=Priapulus caudatus TaxID=37621 RepID=A0ABM1DPD6_PRICU|nr:PREDICTED: protoheme IX farnesyltransferase, mitochondrial-like [Priapulus caudatus]